MIYQTPAQDSSFEIEVKKSRFIGYCLHIDDRQHAMQKLDQIKVSYPDARHHCWAYILGPAQQAKSAAMSDDGEPSGTAGKPILNVLQHKLVADIMIIVIRYFGGIKLGAGGLVRAYSQAAQSVYEQTDFLEIAPTISGHLDCDFKNEQSIRHWFQKNGGHIKSVNYALGARLTFELPPSQLSDLENQSKIHNFQYLINE